ncbi:dihydrodipicolinate synthase family protein [Streptomyces sp. NBC_01017]|uniref:dihydrodipicolinate synthase family protein n=1 Tax=Streptomyces sp. NBC_01017 TaxID=2903721 RepID=UPI003866B60A|nr:dihydrodipicolinate synthase family protein [Streptomyces sp. NBC_01017]
MRTEGDIEFQGVLFFPVTPFGADGSLDEERLARHIESGVAAGAGGVFVACGPGEFHALTPDEIEQATRVAVQTTAGRVPVLAAAVGPPPMARDQAARIERAGADGLLLRDGAVAVPTGPGLGVALDHDALDRRHGLYVDCGMRSRDDTGYMRRIRPEYEGRLPRW